LYNSKVLIGAEKEKTGGNRRKSKLENSDVSRKLKLKQAQKACFSSLNLAKMVEIGQV